MSITVSDCLTLPALREAQVVAGRGGLERIVTSVSVLEYPDTSVLDEGLFIGNEMMITALVSIKDDPSTQCEVLARLNEVGVVVVVLYYVGIFIKQLDPSVMETAEALNMPLICMPTSRYDFRYGEVISDVMEAIFRDQMQETSFVSAMLERLSQLPERQRTITTVLRMLSDRLRCSLLLTDNRMQQKGEAAWPMSSSWDYGRLLEEFRQLPSPAGRDGVTTMELNGRTVYVHYRTVYSESFPDLSLFLIDESMELTEYHVQQSVELIQLFISIWQYDFVERGADALVKAILGDEPALVNQLATQLHIQVSAINCMWVLKESGIKSEKELRQINARRAAVGKLFLQEQRRLALVDTYEDTVVMFTSMLPHAELSEGVERQFLESLQEPGKKLVLGVFPNLQSTRDVRESYILFQECFQVAHTIYPSREILDLHELRFVQKCRRMVEQGESGALLDLLHPLHSEDATDDLLDTLAVFLLDANSNMQRTGDLMFLHKNTVKYRINKIKQRLGLDVTEMPEAYSLYQAVALHRLVVSATVGF